MVQFWSLLQVGPERYQTRWKRVGGSYNHKFFVCDVVARDEVLGKTLRNVVVVD